MKTLAILLAAAVGWVGSAAASPADEVLEIRFREEARIAGPWLKFGDVAELSGLSESRILELAELKLSHAPLAGVRRVLTQQEVTRRLRQAGVSEQLRYTATPSGAVVTAAVKDVSGEELVEFGMEFLRKRIEYEEAEVSIERPEFPGPVTVPDVETRLEAEVSAEHLVGLVPVTVDVWAEGRREARRLLSYRVHIRMPVIHLTRDLPAGAVIAEGDLTKQVRDLESAPRDTMIEAEQVVGMKLVRALSQGSLIASQDIARPLEVKRGSVVTLVAKVGSVEARASAVSREAGAAGDVVNVTNTDTKRTVRARVVSGTMVEAVIP